MTLGQPALLDVVVWGTRWLWFCVAGGVLAAGVAAHYFSRGRLAAIAGGMVGIALLATLIAPELTLSISQYAGVGILLLIAVVWSLRVSGMPIGPGRALGLSSPIRRAESSRADSRSGRYGSSVIASPQGLAATATAQEVRS